MNLSENKRTTSTRRQTEINTHGPVLLTNMRGEPLALFGAALVGQLKPLNDRADKDIHRLAVAFTATIPQQFRSHPQWKWRKPDGIGFPPSYNAIAGCATRMARATNKVLLTRSCPPMTRLKPLPELGSCQATVLKIKARGVELVPTMNGTALAAGAEVSMASDLRTVVDGNRTMGLSKVSPILTPGGGGAQRVPRMIGKPFTPTKTLAIASLDNGAPKINFFPAPSRASNTFAGTPRNPMVSSTGPSLLAAPCRWLTI